MHRNSPLAFLWAAFAMAAGIVLFAAPAPAQSNAAQQRRDMLARIQELVNDPDPLQRLANFEEIVAQNDALKLQIAVEIAMTGNDPRLRAVAWRAYIGGARRLLLTLSLDPSIQAALDRAGQDPKKTREVLNNHRHLFNLTRTGMTSDIRVDSFDFQSGRGQALFSQTGRRDLTEFQVNGDRLIARPIGLQGASTSCSIELRPTPQLKIDGYMSCEGAGFGKVRMTGQIY